MRKFQVAGILYQFEQTRIANQCETGFVHSRGYRSRDEREAECAKKCKIMPRRVSPGADKVNETGEPTLQKIYEPLQSPRGGCRDETDVAPGVPTPRLAGAARTLTVKTVVLQPDCTYSRYPIRFQLIPISRQKRAAPSRHVSRIDKDLNFKSFVLVIVRKK